MEENKTNPTNSQKDKINLLKAVTLGIRSVR